MQEKLDGPLAVFEERMKPGLTVVKEQKRAEDVLEDIRQRAKERQAQEKERGRDDDPDRGR